MPGGEATKQVAGQPVAVGRGEEPSPEWRASQRVGEPSAAIGAAAGRTKTSGLRILDAAAASDRSLVIQNQRVTLQEPEAWNDPPQRHQYCVQLIGLFVCCYSVAWLASDVSVALLQQILGCLFGPQLASGRRSDPTGPRR